MVLDWNTECSFFYKKHIFLHPFLPSPHMFFNNPFIFSQSPQILQVKFAKLISAFLNSFETVNKV